MCSWFNPIIRPDFFVIPSKKSRPKITMMEIVAFGYVPILLFHSNEFHKILKHRNGQIHDLVHEHCKFGVAGTCHPFAPRFDSFRIGNRRTGPWCRLRVRSIVIETSGQDIPHNMYIYTFIYHLFSILYWYIYINILSIIKEIISQPKIYYTNRMPVPKWKVAEIHQKPVVNGVFWALEVGFFWPREPYL